MYPDNYSFIAIFSYIANGVVEISFPDLPGCSRYIHDTDNMIKAAENELGLFICTMENNGYDIPRPSHISEINFKSNEVPLTYQSLYALVQRKN